MKGRKPQQRHRRRKLCGRLGTEKYINERKESLTGWDRSISLKFSWCETNFLFFKHLPFSLGALCRSPGVKLGHFLRLQVRPHPHGGAHILWLVAPSSTSKPSTGGLSPPHTHHYDLLPGPPSNFKDPVRMLDPSG